MSLSIDLSAISANWRALAALAPGARTGAVVKADAYGLGVAPVVPALTAAGVREFFTFTAREGQAIRPLAGPGARIFVMEGHVPGAPLDGLIPCLVSAEQFFRDRTVRPRGPFAIQLDTGMNRLGIRPADWAALRGEVLAAGPELLMSHLASADEPGSPQSDRQLALFASMTAGASVARSLAATGGILRGNAFHFDLTRPGVGLYGALPFAEAQPVVRLSLPVIQIHHLRPGEQVGYGATWTATRPSRIATLGGGYADGIMRRLTGTGLRLWAGERACPVVGRISMDSMAADVTDLPEVPPAMELIGPHQSVDALARQAGTIGYEVLTSLGRRWPRSYA